MPNDKVTTRSTAGNLFDGVADRSPTEQNLELLSASSIRIERIVSTGQASPPDFWYDQPWTEWVMVVSGSASLRFFGQTEPHRMKPGDYVLIPPHRRHRVESTDPNLPTIWLAIHFDEVPTLETPPDQPP